MLSSRFLLLPVAVGIFATIGCCKDQAVTLYAFHGKRSLKECQALAKQFDDPQIVVSCPGETVTLYWDGTVETIDYGKGPVKVKGAPGVQHIQVNESVTVTANSPSGSCAGDASVKIVVPKGDQKYTMEARWDFKAGRITATIPEEFISPKLRAIDITGDPMLNYVPGTAQPCFEKPILFGIQIQESYSFEMDRPDVTKAFSRPLRPSGTWAFVPKCTKKKPTNEDDWARDALYLFQITLRCQ